MRRQIDRQVLELQPQARPRRHEKIGRPAEQLSQIGQDLFVQPRQIGRLGGAGGVEIQIGNHHHRLLGVAETTPSGGRMGEFPSQDIADQLELEHRGRERRLELDRLVGQERGAFQQPGLGSQVDVDPLVGVPLSASAGEAIPTVPASPRSIPRESLGQ